MIKTVIMAGGSGSRLWPLSRGSYPKQFLKLFGVNTMLQETCLRMKNFGDGNSFLSPLIVCNEEHRFIAAEQIRQININDSTIILEPFGKNTAAAIALAAFHSVTTDENTILLVLPADHHIEDLESFHLAIHRAIPLAESGRLVTFGIKPFSPETGYGYIEAGASIDSHSYNVTKFIEKPTSEIAQKLLDSDRFLWNSGIFMFKACTYLKELLQYRPDIYDTCMKSHAVATSEMGFLRVSPEVYSTCPSESIDYAVMENTSKAAVVKVSFSWSDVGSFVSLGAMHIGDQDDNVVIGNAVSLDSKGNYIHAEDKVVAVVGIENLIIIDTKDALLVSHKDRAQEIKQVVEKLTVTNKKVVETHREVYRPWGKYDAIDSGERFQVKRITVRPGAKLSVQMHHHRAEHWIVVSGTAKVTIDSVEQYLTENESVYIPITSVHSLENPGCIDLQLIEVQSGSYLGEDDIVRFEDRYGRA